MGWAGDFPSLEDCLRPETWVQDWERTKNRHPCIAGMFDRAAHAYQKKIVNLNVNVLLAAYPSIEAASSASSAMQNGGYSPEITSLAAATIDWAVYIPIHIGLHYFANREKFRDETGRFQRRAFLRDTGKVYATQLPSIALFYVLAGPLHYAGMRAGLPADTANRVSYWGTLVATRLLHTYIGFKAGLFDDQKNASSLQ